MSCFPVLSRPLVKHIAKMFSTLHRESLLFDPKRNVMLLQSKTLQMEQINGISNFISVKLQCYLSNNVLHTGQCPSLQRLSSVRTYVSSNLCWNCNKAVERSTMFCDTCNSLQPINKNNDFFQILGINRSFRTENSELRQKYRKLQTLLHPDKFSTKSKKEQELSEEFSSTVNKAYYILQNPLERGLYLLSLNNIFIGEENTDMDKDFLMEIMERNEEIENETDPQNLKELNMSNKGKLDSLIGKVAEAFDSENVELAKKLLTEMKYYNSIDVKIKEIKQKLNIPD